MRNAYLPTIASYWGSVLLLSYGLLSCQKDSLPPQEALGSPSILSFYPEAGAVGDTVTITGQNFSRTPANNRVSFASAQTPAGSVRKNSFRDTLRVVVPAGATSGPLAVAVYSQVNTSTTPFLVTASRWQRKARFGGGPRTQGSGYASFSVGGRAYIRTVLNALWSYDPVVDQWTRQADCIAPLPSVFTDANGAIGFALGNAGYIGVPTFSYPNAGYVFYRYAPQTNTWSAVAPLPALTTDPRRLTSFVVDGKAYVVVTDNFADKAVWEYDPQTNAWSRKRPFPGSYRFLCLGFALGSTGYVGGGTTGGSPLLKELWAYNPQSDTWTRKADMVQAGEGLRVFTIGDNAYVSFGNAGAHVVQAYSPLTEQWTRQADYRGPAYSLTVAMSLADKGYLVGGRGVGNDLYTDTWQFSVR